MKIFNIIWETDGEQVDLPSEVQVEPSYRRLDEDEVADYLSDKYGWLVNSFEIEGEYGYCPICGHAFEQGEMDYNYDTAHTDYVCPECDWEGNETEVEEDEPSEMQIWDGSLDEEELEEEGYGVMVWPESQELMEMKGFRDNTWLINDEEGLDMYGSSAYVFDLDWYKENQD